MCFYTYRVVIRPIQSDMVDKEGKSVKVVSRQANFLTKINFETDHYQLEVEQGDHRGAFSCSFTPQNITTKLGSCPPPHFHE